MEIYDFVLSSSVLICASVDLFFLPIAASKYLVVGKYSRSKIPWNEAYKIVSEIGLHSKSCNGKCYSRRNKHFIDLH